MTNSSPAPAVAEPPAEDLVVEVRNVTAGYLPGVNILNAMLADSRAG